MANKKLERNNSKTMTMPLPPLTEQEQSSQYARSLEEETKREEA